MGIEFKYLTEPPRKYTFEQTKLKFFVESFCKGTILNLFAGRTLLNRKEIRVDINPDMPADFHMDALYFISSWKGGKFDTVILDPPYNIRKAREKYEINQNVYHKGKLTIIKDLLPSILNPSAHVISLGYDSGGMSRIRGFLKIAICLVCYNGDHNDTICLVEKYQNVQCKLFH